MSRAVLLMAVVLALAAASPAAAREACWSGWGYRVEPETLAFRSERLLLVTDGPVDWEPGNRIALYPLDPKTGQRDPDAQPLVVIPRQPRFGSAHGNRTMDDVAEVVGQRLDLMLGMTRIGPTSMADRRQNDFLAWACGRAQS